MRRRKRCHSEGSGSDPRNLGVEQFHSAELPQVATAPFGMTNGPERPFQRDRITHQIAANIT